MADTKAQIAQDKADGKADAAQAEADAKAASEKPPFRETADGKPVPIGCFADDLHALLDLESKFEEIRDKAIGVHGAAKAAHAKAEAKHIEDHQAVLASGQNLPRKEADSRPVFLASRTIHHLDAVLGGVAKAIQNLGHAQDFEAARVKATSANDADKKAPEKASEKKS
jgi:hypothetical protein